MQRIFQYIRPPPPSKRKRFFLPSAAEASIPIPIADFSMRHCIRNSYAWGKNRHVRIICRRAVSRAGEVQGHQRGARPDLRRDVRVLIGMGLGRAQARKPNPISIGCDEEEKSETNKKNHHFLRLHTILLRIRICVQRFNSNKIITRYCPVHVYYIGIFVILPPPSQTNHVPPNETPNFFSKCPVAVYEKENEILCVKLKDLRVQTTTKTTKVFSIFSSIQQPTPFERKRQKLTCLFCPPTPHKSP